MKTKKLFLAICCLVAIVGCKKQLGDEPTPPLNLNSSAQVGNPKNPYSVANMRKAMSSLLMKDVVLMANNKQQYSHGKIMAAAGNEALTINKTLTAKESMTLAQQGITATHYYIKFMPRNEADYNKLKLDSNLMIYPFPLDNETNQYSGNYRDPAVPAGVPTYQYAAVPVTYLLPDVPYVKLEDLFLPDEQSANSTVTIAGAGNSAYSVPGLALVDEAMCGIDEDEPIDDGSELIEQLPDDCGGGGGGSGSYPPNNPHRNGRNWRPNGRITVYDDTKQQTIGLEGVKVRARRWFTTYTGIADANGYYAVDGWFTRPANYWLDFERYDFAIRHPLGHTFEVNGPKIEAAWNRDLTGYDKFCATIFRAAFHYYYKDIQGLRRPPQNSFWNTQMKLTAYPEINPGANGDHDPGRRFLGMGEAIHMYNPNRASQDIYATTIHELAHAVHWDMAADDYRNANDNISDSWSVGVQWVLTKMVYPDYLGRPNGTPKYTNLIMDLIDFPGQEYSSYGKGSPIDQVQGYNIVQIQNALIDARNFGAWKNNLFYQYENSTENHLEALFNYWDLN